LSEQQVEVVDNYIEEIENRSDNTLGHFASYLGNVQAAIGRWEFERLALAKKPDVLVTCGSIVESTVYNAIQALIQHRSEDGALTLRELQNDRRASVSMTFMGIMRHDAFEYDHVFYLPLSEERKDEDDVKWEAAVDDHIPEAAEALGVQYIALPEDPDERLAKVLETVLVSEATTSE
jgi:hypothetical protein